MKSLQGKIALVTGGTRGIGKAISQRLAADGAFVAIHYGSNHEEAKKTLHEIEILGGKGVLITADLKENCSVESLFAQLDRTLNDTFKNNQFDILVNNAGIGLIEEVETTREEQMDDLLSINVKAPFFIAQQSLSRLRNGGRIVNITSVVTRMAMPSVGAYSMTKGAVDVLTLILAKKLGARQITVNSVAPGVINTELNAGSLSHPESRKFMESLSVFNRVGESDDIADVVAFVVSEEARWISGQRIEASGGTFLG